MKSLMISINVSPRMMSWAVNQGVYFATEKSKAPEQKDGLKVHDFDGDKGNFGKSTVFVGGLIEDLYRKFGMVLISVHAFQKVVRGYNHQAGRSENQVKCYLRFTSSREPLPGLEYNETNLEVVKRVLCGRSFRFMQIYHNQGGFFSVNLGCVMPADARNLYTLGVVPRKWRNPHDPFLVKRASGGNAGRKDCKMVSSKAIIKEGEQRKIAS